MESLRNSSVHSLRTSAPKELWVFHEDIPPIMLRVMFTIIIMIIVVWRSWSGRRLRVEFAIIIIFSSIIVFQSIV